MPTSQPSRPARARDHAAILTRLVALLVVLLAPRGAAAQEEHPIQLSLLSPVQIYDETDAISGLRLSLLYGKNTNVTGLDFSFVANHVTGDFKGVQLGIVGVIDGNSTGWQWNAVNFSRGDFNGLQLGLYNRTTTGRGVQFGTVNHTTGASYRGLQVSIVNYAQRIDGVQIGLLNIIKEGGQFPFFPIVNWGNE